MQLLIEPKLPSEPPPSLGSPPVEDEGEGIRAAVQEECAALQSDMESRGRFCYQGAWRTAREIRWLDLAVRFRALGRCRDIGLLLLIAAAAVLVTYKLLFLMFQ